MKPKVKKGLKITGNVFFWLFFAAALSMTIFAFTARSSATGAPQFGNKVLLSVKSESMTGTFNKGDLIICEVREENDVVDYQIGDVVTFDYEVNPGEHILNTHTIVSKTGEGAEATYQTQGDNKETNPTVDGGFRTMFDIKAKWTGKRIIALGAIIGFLQSSTGFLVCVVIPLVLFFVYELVQLILIIAKSRAKKTMGNITKEQEEMIKQKAIEEFLKKQNEAKSVEDTEENK